MNAATIIAELPNLSGPDLQKVRASLGFLTSDVSAPPDDFANKLFEAMRAELHYSPHYGQFAKTNRYSTWAGHLSAIQEFVNKQFKFEQLHSTAQRGLLRLLIRLLMDDLMSIGAPVCMGTVAVNIGRLDEVFDNAFPGYMDGGLAYLIPSRMRRPKDRR